jgi:hypothetical protein
MPFLDSSQRSFLQAVSSLVYCNPFLPERIEFERQALGPRFKQGGPVWSMRVSDPRRPHDNALKIFEEVESLAAKLRDALQAGGTPRQADLPLYEDAVFYLLYYRHFAEIPEGLLAPMPEKAAPERWPQYKAFLQDWRHFFQIPKLDRHAEHEPAHTFACFFQVRRAFHNIFTYIIGGSLSAARLRAAVWQSIFTYDMCRYRRALYSRMGDFATLITGPSGTGKELVARAIAASRYVPFDENRLSFSGDWRDSFHPINLAALSPTLIESELFGHRRGAFTGAVQDRRGWLEVCPPLGCVFLDEIGDLDPAIQVKLLRVIETRLFTPVGDTGSRQFHGKLIAATNRDLALLMQEERFREDFYYRLCSDQIVTPSLADQIRESADVLSELIVFMARRVAGEEAAALAQEVETWVAGSLGQGYHWPGNYRELEQCVRNVLIRREYRPPRRVRRPLGERIFHDAREGRLTAEELLGWYCTLVYSKTGSYEESARRLGLDRRTVKSKINLELLEEMGGETQA